MAYKVTDELLRSCRVPPYAGRFFKQYGFNHTVDLGLVFKTLKDVRAFTKKAKKIHNDKVFEVECSHTEPCNILTNELEEFLRFFKTGKYPQYPLTPPKGTMWGFDIRLMREII